MQVEPTAFAISSLPIVLMFIAGLVLIPNYPGIGLPLVVMAGLLLLEFWAFIHFEDSNNNEQVGPAAE